MAVGRRILRTSDPVRDDARLGLDSSDHKQRGFIPILYSIVSRSNAARDRSLADFRSSANNTRIGTYPGSLRDLASVSSTKKGPKSSIGHQSENNQPVRASDPLQNGRIEIATRRNSTGRLDGKVGLAGCIPSPANSSQSSPILPLSVGKSLIRMASRSIRLPRRTASIHSCDASSSNSGKTARYSSDCLHGRHTRALPLTGAGDQRSRQSPAAAGVIRLVAEHKEVSLHSNSANRFPRSHGGLTIDEVLSPIEEARRASRARAGDATTRTKRKANTAIPTSVPRGTSTVGIGLHSTMPPPLQLIDRGTAPRSTSPLHNTHTSSNQGVAVVGEQHREMEWKGHNPNSTQTPVRYRRIGEGLGSSALPNRQQSSDRLPGFLHLGNDQQYEGIDSDSKRSSISSESTGLDRFVDSSPNRQSNSNELHQPHGGSITSPLSNSRRNSRLLFRSKTTTHSRIPAWSRERGSRSAVSHRERYLRATAESSDFQTDRSSVGSTHDRCVCIRIKHTTPQLCELANRYRMPIHRHFLKENSFSREPLVLSSIPDNRSIIEEDRERESYTNIDSASMAQSALVADVVASVPGLANPPAPIAALPAVVAGGEQKGEPNQMVLDRSTLIKQYLRSQGLSESSIDVWFLRYKHGERAGTNRGLDGIWKRYCTWCTATSRCPTNFKIADILCYANDIIIDERKLTAKTALTFISAISTTHQVLTDGQPEISKLPLVIQFRKGLVNKKPAVSAKPDTYFSLHAVFRHLRSLSQDDYTCPLPILRNKLVTLLTIDGMARSSDITSITRDTIRFEDERVHFTYYATKESKSFQEVPMFINSYKEEKLICTVSVLQAYLTRTRDYSLHNNIEFVLHIVDGKEIRRSPLLVSDYRNRDDKFFELSTQRIAKINTDVLKKLNITVFKAHSYRGASSSKVYNLGGDIQRVLERARWASDATFRKYYLRKKAYQQHSRSNQYLTIEFLLRMRTDPAGSVKRKESTLVDRDEEKEVIVVDDEVES